MPEVLTYHEVNEYAVNIKNKLYTRKEEITLQRHNMNDINISDVNVVDSQNYKRANSSHRLL